MTTSPTRLGLAGPSVFPLALGCMGMGAGNWYGPSDESENIATIHEALDRGVNLIDTGDFYGMGHNELLVGKALRGRRDQALLSVKYGALRGPDGAFLGHDARPAATKNFLAYSLSRLGVDHIDIYRPARLDPAVPIEDTIGAIADLVKAGYVRYISLSEMGADTVQRAARVHPIADLQIEYSLISRGPEHKVFPALASLGVAVTAYGVLARGLLAGSKPTGAHDLRAHMPRFAGANGEKNLTLVDALARLAAARGVTPSQLAIAWVRAKGAAQNVTVIPTLGARTRKQLAEALSGLDIELNPSELAELEAAVPAEQVAGTRYPAPMMATLDSEKLGGFARSQARNPSPKPEASASDSPGLRSGVVDLWNLDRSCRFRGLRGPRAPGAVARSSRCSIGFRGPRIGAAPGNRGRRRAIGRAGFASGRGEALGRRGGWSEPLASRGDWARPAGIEPATGRLEISCRGPRDDRHFGHFLAIPMGCDWRRPAPPHSAAMSCRASCSRRCR